MGARRVSTGTLLIPALVALGLAVAAQWWASRARHPGNSVVFLNATEASVDSVVITADPPTTNPLSGRLGYVAARDSAWLALPAGSGDASVRVFRAGRVVADHLVYFGGDSEFELWIGDGGSLGRYRRSGSASVKRSGT